MILCSFSAFTLLVGKTRPHMTYIVLMGRYSINQSYKVRMCKILDKSDTFFVES